MWSSHVIIAGVLCVTLWMSHCEAVSGNELTEPRPSYREYAKMARYLVHKSNWTSMGTISTIPNFTGYPMVNIKSIADSANNAPSTGRIIFLLTDMDFTGKDLAVNNKLTAMFTEDQDLACTSKNVDTMEPTCARAIFIGKLKRLTPGTAEHTEADQWFTNRHPASILWRQTHTFYFCQLDIQHITIIDFYGGAHTVTPDDYYAANYDADANEIDDFQPSVVQPKQTSDKEP